MESLSVISEEEIRFRLTKNTLSAFHIHTYFHQRLDALTGGHLDVCPCQQIVMVISDTRMLRFLKEEDRKENNERVNERKKERI